MIRRNWRRITLILVCLGIQACGVFLSPYSATSYEHFTNLKAFHLKFIDDFTARAASEYDSARVQERFDQGDLLFRQAIEYENQISKDAKRLNAFRILYEQFQDDRNQLLTSGRLYSPAFAGELKEQVELNYNKAIEGELSRRGAPTNP